MDLLDQEISGPAITVRIRGVERPLAYPLHAVILYQQLTAVAATKTSPAVAGDSLFKKENYDKIDLGTDPDRWLKCLWAGLHELQPDRSWKAPFTLDELGALIDFSNAGDVSIAMVRALTQSMPKAKKGDESPKAAAPGEPEPEAQSPKLPSLTDSGRERVADLISAGMSS